MPFGSISNGEAASSIRSKLNTLLAYITGKESDINSISGKASTGYVDAKIVQTITNGVTTSAPSQDVVFDAFAAKDVQIGALDSAIQDLQAQINVLVPFDGAGQNVNLGEFNINAKGLELSYEDNGDGSSPITNNKSTGTFIMPTGLSMIRVFNDLATISSTIMVQIYDNPTGWGGGVHLEVERGSGFFQVVLYVAGSEQAPPVDTKIGFFLCNPQP